MHRLLAVDEGLAGDQGLTVHRRPSSSTAGADRPRDRGSALPRGGTAARRLSVVAHLAPARAPGAAAERAAVLARASSTSSRSCCCWSPRSGPSTASPARSRRSSRSTTSSRCSPARCTRRSRCAPSGSRCWSPSSTSPLALPIAFYMAKVASPRCATHLVIAVLMPLWASYLVKAYAWRSVLSQDGILEWMLAPFGLHTPGYGLTATIITLSYLWLPYVILPIYAGLERVPDSLLEASADLGGKTWRTLPSSCCRCSSRDHRRHDLQLLAVARRLHHGQHRRRREPDARQPRLHERRRGEQSAARGGDRAHPDRDHLRLPRSRCAAPAR